MKLSGKLFISAASSVLCLLSLPASAHTGVGDTTGFAAGFGHPMGGMDHMLAMIAVGLWAAQMGGRAVWVVPGAFVGMMIVGGALGIAGVQVPFIEQGILVSVLVLGLLIAGAVRLPLAVSSLLVGIFALFHGHAHGVEMPVAIGAVSYGAGFALATAMLHAVGILAGMWVKIFSVEKVARLAGFAITLGGVYLALA
jgi:urease accessory protein